MTHTQATQATASRDSLPRPVFSMMVALPTPSVSCLWRLIWPTTLPGQPGDRCELPDVRWEGAVNLAPAQRISAAGCTRGAPPHAVRARARTPRAQTHLAPR
eukprot:scaffold11161_cov76-Isochrysis_galbana.AAC.1